MFHLYAKKNQLTVRGKELLTSGSVNVYQVRFQFSEDWDELNRTAAFRVGGQTWEVLLDNTGECIIPWEALQEPGKQLYIGVYGTKSGAVVLPTIWAYGGTILEGASPRDSSRPPTPDVYDQLREEISGKGDRLAYTEDGRMGLYAGDKLLNSVPLESGGGGTTDHRALDYRDSPGQHPIEAITGLKEAVDSIPAPTERITNSELEEMLK